MKPLAFAYVLAGLCLTASAGPNTSITYASAFAQGITTLFPNGGTAPRSDAITTYFFTGVLAVTNGSPAELASGCQGGPGNGTNGCPATRVVSPGEIYTLGANSTSASISVNNGLDQEQYQATGTASVFGLNDSASLSVSRGAGSASQSNYISAYAVAGTPLVVSQPGQAGNAGFLLLTYTLQAPIVSGSASDPSSAVWFGEWTFRSWSPTGNNATSQYQNGGVDFASMTGPMQVTFTVPFVFGSAVDVTVAEQLGVGWIANTANPTSAVGLADPMSSLTGIVVLDSNLNNLSGFTITDDAGDTFGPAGANAPEPGSTLCVGTGLLALILVGRRFVRS